MLVAEYDRYGGPDVVQLRDAQLPRPRWGQVLVRVHAAALNPKDVLTRAGKYPLMAGRHFPKRLGYDWAGEAVALGPGARRVRVGDALFGMIQAWSAGACAEYALVSARELAPKPSALSWQEAAAIPLAGLTALQALRDEAKLRAGQRVLINGASGGVGVYAVQIAKALGAHVTSVTSARNVELARSLGADETLDHAVDDIERASTPYDVFFDVFGNRSFRRARAVLTARGTYVSTVPKPDVIRDRILTLVRSQRARLVVVRSNARDLRELAAMVERGSLRPVIEQVYPLGALSDAQRALATKRTRGKLVIALDDARAPSA